MDQLGLGGVTQHPLDVEGRLARDQPRLGAAVVGQAARQFLARQVDDRDDVAAMELAGHLLHADRQQALAFVAQLDCRAGIDDHLPSQLQMVDHPLLASRQLGGRRHQGRADRLAVRQPQQHVGLPAPGDHGVGAAARRALGRQDLGDHPAPPDARSRAAGHLFQLGSASGRAIDEARVRVLARIGGIQALLVRQDHQGVRLDQVRHQRAQRVVVTELDLVVDDRIVLVDDRQHAMLQQRQQGRARVQVALAIGQVRMRQQHLRAGEALFAQLGLVHLRQAHLADGGGGLQLVQLLRPAGPAQALHAFGDRAAGDHHHLAPLAGQFRQLAAPVADGLGVHASPLVGHQAGAHLHDDPSRVPQDTSQFAVQVAVAHAMGG